MPELKQLSSYLRVRPISLSSTILTSLYVGWQIGTGKLDLSMPISRDYIGGDILLYLASGICGPILDKISDWIIHYGKEAKTS